jgi:hypothetical protein
VTHYPNDKGEYKSKGVLLKLYPSDLIEIDRQAKLLNLSRTEYITKCVLDKPVEKKHIFKVSWQTYRVMGEIGRELQRIGNNINQIAKAFNTERLVGDILSQSYPLSEELSAIKAYTDKTAKELNQIRLLLIGREKQ